MLNWTSLKLETNPSKNFIKRKKKESPAWEKIFATHVSGKELVCGIDKEILQCINNKLNTLDKRFEHSH